MLRISSSLTSIFVVGYRYALSFYLSGLADQGLLLQQSDKMRNPPVVYFIWSRRWSLCFSICTISHRLILMESFMCMVCIVGVCVCVSGREGWDREKGKHFSSVWPTVTGATSPVPNGLTKKSRFCLFILKDSQTALLILLKTEYMSVRVNFNIRKHTGSSMMRCTCRGSLTKDHSHFAWCSLPLKWVSNSWCKGTGCRFGC